MPQTDTTTQTISRAAAYRQRREQGQIWKAPSGEEIRVRPLDLADHAVIGQFPDSLRQTVYKMIEGNSVLKGKTEAEMADELFAGLSGEEILSHEFQIGAALCKLGWIEPQVVDEVTDPDTQIATTEVDAIDRRAYTEYVFGGNAQEAQSLTTFPAGQDGSVRPVSPLQGVQQGSKRKDAAGGSRVLASDSV